MIFLWLLGRLLILRSWPIVLTVLRGALLAVTPVPLRRICARQQEQ